MLSSRAVWIWALYVGSMTHLDWHLGRPGHDHLSFHLPYHWLLAIPTFLPVAWIVHVRGPDAPVRAGMLTLLLGLLIGQGLEPLGEVLLGGGAEPFTNPVRWRIFAEFLGAGVLSFSLGVPFIRYVSRSRRPSAPGGT
jgi:xanthosine utilization system XapX-like protein